ncbi:MAG: TatD family hydrolase [Saccharofermentans sp.]|nr:TatD family hydrolase [Saccharofermentans sp.]
MREPKYYPTKIEGIFDTHAHLYDERYGEEGTFSSDVLERCAMAGVTRVLVPADNMESSKAAMSYVEVNQGLSGVDLYCSIGIHPHEASSYCPEVRQWLIDTLQPEVRSTYNIMALGEIGLDYHYDLSPRDVQREVFKDQLNIAYELDIPIILHEREAVGDSMDILRSFKKEGRLRSNPGVCHCCSASPEIAAELVSMGFYIGFDGPITFKNNKSAPEVLNRVPLDRIVIETDSPYLTPEPNRGLTNEPCYVPFVAAKIADIKGMSVEEIVKITSDNGCKLYGINF